MNRFLLDLQNLDWQNQEIVSDTPLRGDHPRLRRTRLLDDTKSVSPIDHPRKCSGLRSKLISVANTDREATNAICDLQIRVPELVHRTGVFQMAGDSEGMESGIGESTNYHGNHRTVAGWYREVRPMPRDYDARKGIDSLETIYRRKALRAIMLEQVLIPELDQDKILRFSGSMVRRPRNPPHSEYEKKESWKCVPRKRILIGSADKMLSVPEDVIPLGDNFNKAMDWSCNNMLAVSNNDHLIIYDNDGEKVLSSIIRCKSITYNDFGQIIDLKWASDGNKLIMSVFIYESYTSMLVMYDLKKQKILWDVMCKCLLENEGCIIRCVCWSAYDRQIVTGCSGKISIFDSDTGILLHTRRELTRTEILNLSFSPNHKYLVSTGVDKMVRLFFWSELTPCFNIRFFKPVKAIAWHPQISDLLCIGGRKNGSLSLWNVNKCAMTAFVRAKFNGRVENLAWNKLSGELVVHWTYKEEDNICTIVAVLASFNRIVDVLPLDKKMRVCFLKFNAAHEQLRMQILSFFFVFLK
ncbi:Protein cortex [Trachymyrmex zeteki]|uniref:Protein cortex n=1 Tax=Mycetomoellerius zeteki TaxID=64791 RepID=A0A151WRA9_9HYME|nr:Protein cortex [Trachymyrmex zeteki]